MRASPSPVAPPFMVRPQLPVAHGPETWDAKGRPRSAVRSGCLPTAAAAEISGPSRTAGHLPGEPRLQRPQFSRGRSLLGPLSCRFRPEIPWDQLGSPSWEVHFPPDPSAILIHSQRVAKDSEAILPHADDFPLPPDPLDWIQEERTLQRGSSNQTPHEEPPLPVSFGSVKLRSARGRPSLSIANSVRIPGDPLSSG